MALLEPGMPAPPLHGRDQDGKEVSLEEYRGRKVLIYFYPKDDTPGCTAEACAFRDNLPNFNSVGVDVLGVSVDSEARHRKFADKYQLPFRLLADTEKSVVEAYGVWGPKKFMGREYMGTSRVSYLVDEEGKIENVWPKVKAADHPRQVLEWLESKQ
ncbi:thioredoxin-dependent thiol peroxidase [Chlorobium sp. N1]|uniref:thioredoxin-dependent thiol peroxidase n=1 Tax=Chlorobium sp. N1 TaxID=2491138 RepID=UPI00103CC5E2|nr:thioredoxin-dependent thiol peroxidase [Chlorobium sp. N1]TCD47354.1 thioredoxin-dependent thiol peroxidase [Chlorobium sp. N1]